MENIYYVYSYLDINGLPYYIGKGKHTRAYDYHDNIKVPEDIIKILFLGSMLSEKEAFSLENRFITKLGRRDLYTDGLLENKTGGRIKSVKVKNKRITLHEIEAEIEELVIQHKIYHADRKLGPAIRKDLAYKRKQRLQIKSGAAS
jgi:hypothetical protein